VNISSVFLFFTHPPFIFVFCLAAFKTLRIVYTEICISFHFSNFLLVIVYPNTLAGMNQSEKKLKL